MRVLIMLALIVLSGVHVLRGTWWWGLLGLSAMILLGTAMSLNEWALLAAILEIALRVLEESQ